MALQLGFIPGLKHIRTFFVQSKYHIYLIFLKNLKKKHTKNENFNLPFNYRIYLRLYDLSCFSPISAHSWKVRLQSRGCQTCLQIYSSTRNAQNEKPWRIIKNPIGQLPLQPIQISPSRPILI